MLEGSPLLLGGQALPHHLLGGARPPWTTLFLLPCNVLKHTCSGPSSATVHVTPVSTDEVQSSMAHANLILTDLLSKELQTTCNPLSHSKEPTTYKPSNDSKHPCPHCDKTYVFRSSLTKHMKKDHKGNSNPPDVHSDRSNDSKSRLLCNQCMCR